MNKETCFIVAEDVTGTPTANKSATEFQGRQYHTATTHDTETSALKGITRAEMADLAYIFASSSDKKDNQTLEEMIWWPHTD